MASGLSVTWNRKTMDNIIRLRKRIILSMVKLEQRTRSVRKIVRYRELGGCLLLGGLYCIESMPNSIGATRFVRYIEAVRFWEGPLWEVLLSVNSLVSNIESITYAHPF